MTVQAIFEIMSRIILKLKESGRPSETLPFSCWLQSPFRQKLVTSSQRVSSRNVRRRPCRTSPGSCAGMSRSWTGSRRGRGPSRRGTTSGSSGARTPRPAARRNEPGCRFLAVSIRIKLRAQIAKPSITIVFTLRCGPWQRTPHLSAQRDA